MSFLSQKTAKQQYALAAEAQASQERRLAEEKSRLAAVEAGQKRVRMGGRGLLAFVDGGMAKPAEPGMVATTGGAASGDWHKFGAAA